MKSRYRLADKTTTNFIGSSNSRNSRSFSFSRAHCVARVGSILPPIPHESPNEMPDFFSPQQRSELMSRVRGRGNVSTEKKVVEILRQSGITGWRRHLPLPGRPDFTFPKQRVCIFVHGCFWHDCPRCRKRSKTRPEYWLEKIDTNRKRDRRVLRQLQAKGYRAIVVWECTLRRKYPKAAISQLLQGLQRAGITENQAHYMR
jgi:DNA mismatch endonuclease (patch repair protein)